jgi:hypothetical protein
MKTADQELQRLLARGRLGGPGRERVLARVLQSAARPPARRWRVWIATLALATSGTAALVLMRRTPAGDEFTAKEGAKGKTGVLDLACVGGSSAACAVGSTLVFSAIGSSGPGYLAAYAEPAAGGERIWYFSADGESPAIPVSTSGTRPAPRGVRLGPEHAAGRYLVHVFLTEAPLARRALLEAKRPGLLAQATFPLTVVAP